MCPSSCTDNKQGQHPFRCLHMDSILQVHGLVYLDDVLNHFNRFVLYSLMYYLLYDNIRNIKEYLWGPYVYVQPFCLIL